MSFLDVTKQSELGFANCLAGVVMVSISSLQGTSPLVDAHHLIRDMRIESTFWSSSYGLGGWAMASTSDLYLGGSSSPRWLQCAHMMVVHWLYIERSPCLDRKSTLLLHTHHGRTYVPCSQLSVLDIRRNWRAWKEWKERNRRGKDDMKQSFFFLLILWY